MTDSRPTPPSWINRDLIEEILRTGDEDPSITVSSCEVTAANAAGEGYSNDMFRVVAKVQGSGERRIVIKCQPVDGMRGEAAAVISPFNMEYKVMNETLPKLQKLLDEARPGHFKPIAAKCLYRGKEPIEYLALDDLRHAGFTSAQKHLGLDMDHCTLIVKTLARLHASSLALFDQDPEARDLHRQTIFQESFKQFIEPFWQNALRSLSIATSKWPGYEHYATKFTNKIDSIFDYLAKIFERNDDQLNVLIHADAWSGNMMFKYSEGHVQDIRLVDFQTVTIATPVLELHYFLNTCPNIDVRVNSTEELLQLYHSTFTEILDILGCSKYSMTFQQLQDALKEHNFYGFLIAASVLPICLSDPGKGLDVEEAVTTTADGSGNNARMYSNERYITAMKYLLPLFEKEGVFE